MTVRYFTCLILASLNYLVSGTPSERTLNSRNTQALSNSTINKGVFPDSMEGWLSSPKHTPAKSKAHPNDSRSTDKSGWCGSPESYGIHCAMRLDQCQYDKQCPGNTKCCMIGECGYLCVIPKDKSESVKIYHLKLQLDQLSNSKKKPSQPKRKVNSNGLKLEDIATQEVVLSTKNETVIHVQNVDRLSEPEVNFIESSTSVPPTQENDEFNSIFLDSVQESTPVIDVNEIFKDS